jgi:hypothetical protein
LGRFSRELVKLVLGGELWRELFRVKIIEEVKAGERKSSRKGSAGEKFMPSGLTLAVVKTHSVLELHKPNKLTGGCNELDAQILTALGD